MRSKIDNEVRPSTVKTWLTIWRSFSTRPIDHWLRAVAENRMRTPYATNILARMNVPLYPTRPRREMQSNPRPRSLRSPFLSCRGPPGNNPMIFTRQILTGNSVEIVRPTTSRVAWLDLLGGCEKTDRAHRCNEAHSDQCHSKPIPSDPTLCQPDGLGITGNDFTCSRSI
jgi:hypothetical protein